MCYMNPINKIQKEVQRRQKNSSVWAVREDFIKDNVRIRPCKSDRIKKWVVGGPKGEHGVSDFPELRQCKAISCLWLPGLCKGETGKMFRKCEQTGLEDQITCIGEMEKKLEIYRINFRIYLRKCVLSCRQYAMYTVQLTYLTKT